MADLKELKTLLQSANKRDIEAVGLAVEGKHFVEKRKGETKEEFEKRKKEFKGKKKKRMIKALRDQMMKKKKPERTVYKSK